MNRNSATQRKSITENKWNHADDIYNNQITVEWDREDDFFINFLEDISLEIKYVDVCNSLQTTPDYSHNVLDSQEEVCHVFFKNSECKEQSFYEENDETLRKEGLKVLLATIQREHLLTLLENEKVVSENENIADLQSEQAYNHQQNDEIVILLHSSSHNPQIEFSDRLITKIVALGTMALSPPSL